MDNKAKTTKIKAKALPSITKPNVIANWSNKIQEASATGTTDQQKDTGGRVYNTNKYPTGMNLTPAKVT
ncbi:hypothetical protein PIB30_029362 [Stylosanthes scabra]|uniref:Uncharacterized protein n=1 Tax=Stylosanthes scabra TaxID=79078 RepID=A0ABU6SBC1_9FABA|nr:hypothetical protein [Stylosanthes scabra]